MIYSSPTNSPFTELPKAAQLEVDTVNSNFRNAFTARNPDDPASDAAYSFWLGTQLVQRASKGQPTVTRQSMLAAMGKLSNVDTGGATRRWTSRNSSPASVASFHGCSTTPSSSTRCVTMRPAS